MVCEYIKTDDSKVSIAMGSVCAVENYTSLDGEKCRRIFIGDKFWFCVKDSYDDIIINWVK